MGRYGYAGAWGYEGGPSLWGSASSDPGFLHVGARWYDPAMGRFLQRDPIGILGGLNVYAYVRNKPLRYIDWTGLVPIDGVEWPPRVKTQEERDGERKAAKVVLPIAGAVAGGAVLGPAVGRALPAAGRLLPAARGAAGRAAVWLRAQACSKWTSFKGWLNRGKLRIGKSGPRNGKYYFSIRWKNHHLDLFELW